MSFILSSSTVVAYGLVVALAHTRSNCLCSGGGPNNERVLHTVSTNGECSDKWGNILKMSKTDLDTEVKRALEYKFGREVPDAIDTVYKYWDEGVW